MPRNCMLAPGGGKEMVTGRQERVLQLSMAEGKGCVHYVTDHAVGWFKLLCPFQDVVRQL
jgi:hypothetical protein